MQQLQQIYLDYILAVEKAQKEASALSGIFGMKGGAKDDPCHMVFYNAAGNWVTAFLAAQPEEAAAAEAARFLLTAAVTHKNDPTYLTYIAAQGHAKAILPLLSPDSCETLRQEYDRLYPAAQRLPLNDEIYDLLCKPSGTAPKKRRWLGLFGK